MEKSGSPDNHVYTRKHSVDFLLVDLRYQSLPRYMYLMVRWYGTPQTSSRIIPGRLMHAILCATILVYMSLPFVLIAVY